MTLANYGHFTSMQVRGGGVRGLDLHLERLDRSNRELFGRPLPGARVCELARAALGADRDASLRVLVLDGGVGGEPAVIVNVRPPFEMPPAAQSLLSVPYQRPVPHVKQIGGGFGQVYYGRLAEARGFDDALLAAPDGTISEATICNVAFLRGDEVVWPDAPALAGIAMQLLEPRLRSRRATVRLADLGTF